MSQEFLLADASVSGDADNPTNAHGAADGTFTTDIDNESWTHRWGFANPTTDVAVNEAVDAVLRLTVRKWDGTGNPDIDSIELFDSTGSIVLVSTGWSVTSSTSEEITISGIPWTSLTDTTGDSLEVQIVTTAVGGSPPGRAAVQVDEIRLDVTMFKPPIDETGRDFTITSTVDATDVATFDDTGRDFTITSTVDGTDTMPPPAWVRGYVMKGESTSQTTITIAKPTGVVENDIMYAFIIHESGVMTSDTPPSGWTDVGTLPVGFDGGNGYIYTKVAGASEGSDYVFTFDPANQMAGWIVAINGTTHEVDVLVSGEYDDTDTDGDFDVTLSSIDTASVGLIAGIGNDPVTPAAGYYGNTSGMTFVEDTYDQYAGAMCAWFWEAISSITSTTEVLTYGSTGTSVMCFLVAVKPTATVMDETGRDFVITSTVDAPTDKWTMGETAEVVVTSTIDGADAAVLTEDTDITIASTIDGADGMFWTEDTDTSIVSTIDGTDTLIVVGRHAQVSWIEIETPVAGRQGQVSWIEVELEDAARQGQISWIEFEFETAPRQGQVSWMELELEDGARQGQVSWIELELPVAGRQGQLSWIELEMPNAPRQGQISWIEFEVPGATRKAQVSWIEIELPVPARQAQLSWIEVEIPTAPRQGQVSWLELQIPDGRRQAQVSWVVFEMPNAARQGQISWLEVEVPDAPQERQAQVSWIELEIPSLAGTTDRYHDDRRVGSKGRPAILSQDDS